MAMGSISSQEGAEYPIGRRKVKTASSGQKGDEWPRELSEQPRGVGTQERCGEPERASSGQEAEQPGEGLVADKALSFSGGSWMDLHFSRGGAGRSTHLSVQTVITHFLKGRSRILRCRIMQWTFIFVVSKARP